MANACSRLDLRPEQAVAILLRLAMGAKAQQEDKEKEVTAHGGRKIKEKVQ